MAGRLVPGTRLRLRRARRRDLAGILALRGPGAPSLGVRYARRLLTDLRVDVYVADDGSGVLAGVVAVGYTRSLAHGAMCAVLDEVRVQAGAPPALLERLLEFAEDRARRRACVRVVALVGDDAVGAALRARGYRGESHLVLPLGGGG